MCRPLDDIDFEKFPINKADIDPYLRQASDILEINGEFKDLPLSDEFKQLDFQFSPEVNFGQSIENILKIQISLILP